MITREFEARIKRLNRTDVDQPVQVVLSYDAGVDPYAVQAVFTSEGEEGITWSFSRELLSAGAYAKVALGHGDVRFRYYPGRPWPLGQDDVVVMCLRSPEGHADVALPHGEVVAFLGDTQPLFDEASEDCTPAVDQFLKEVFG